MRPAAWLFQIVAAVGFLLPFAATPAVAQPPGGERHLLYVAAPGIRDYLEFGGAGILVFDMDNHFAFIKRIPTPASLKDKPENIKGICASPVTGLLHFSTPTRLYCLDLVTERTLWERVLPGGCDRMALTPNGEHLYVPSFEKGHWNVVHATTGVVVDRIEPKWDEKRDRPPDIGSHNTLCSLDGARAYLAGLRTPILNVVDTKTQKIVQEVGPFSAAIRPFTIDSMRRRCYVNVNGLLGFEVGDLTTGKELGRYEVKGFQQGAVKRHGCPSHGIGLTPDETELWVCDAANSRLHVFDVTELPPKQTTSIALREQPGWVTFSRDGRHAISSTGEIIDTKTKKIVTALKDEEGRAVHSEKVVEVVARGNKVVATGDQFGIGRKGPDPWLVIEGRNGPGKGKHIVLVSGDEEYRSEETLTQLAKILAVRHGFTCTVLYAIDPKTGTINPNVNNNIPGLEALKTADLMVLFTRFRNLPDEQMKHLADYVESGKPIVGLRTATHAFNLNPSSKYYRYSWPKDNPVWAGGFGRQVLGETWISHHGDHGRQSTRGVLAPESEGHPIVRGIEDGDIWGPTDVYGVRLPLPGDSRPLVLGQVLDGMTPDSKPVAGRKNNPMMPIAWTRTYQSGDKSARVFTTTMGASQDLASKGLRRLLVNACYWALQMEDDIDANSGVEIVGEFKPRPFGNNGFVPGKKPADLADE